MGAIPYWYFVDYEQDFNVALQKLREREFRAGRYYPNVMFLDFSIDETKVSPGASHESIEAAIIAAEENGTGSILDVFRVDEVGGFSVARILSSEELLDYFDTEQPTMEMVIESMEIFDIIDRGEAICTAIYEDAKPIKIFFAGYSFD